MGAPSVPVSLRLSADDAQWLASLEIPGASSPGEKLRALLREARAGASRTQPEDYAGWLARTSAAADGPARSLHLAEFAHGMHSELLARFSTWLPEALAFCLATAPDADTGPDELRAFEAGVAERLGVVAQQLLQLAVAGAPPTYDPVVAESAAAPLLDLAEAIRGRKGKKKQKK